MSTCLRVDIRGYREIAKRRAGALLYGWLPAPVRTAPPLLFVGPFPRLPLPVGPVCRPASRPETPMLDKNLVGLALEFQPVVLGLRDKFPQLLHQHRPGSRLSSNSRAFSPNPFGVIRRDDNSMWQ